MGASQPTYISESIAILSGSWPLGPGLFTSTFPLATSARTTRALSPRAAAASTLSPSSSPTPSGPSPGRYSTDLEVEQSHGACVVLTASQQQEAAAFFQRTARKKETNKTPAARKVCRHICPPFHKLGERRGALAHAHGAVGVEVAAVQKEGHGYRVAAQADVHKRLLRRRLEVRLGAGPRQQRDNVAEIAAVAEACGGSAQRKASASFYRALRSDDSKPGQAAVRLCGCAAVRRRVH